MTLRHTKNFKCPQLQTANKILLVRIYTSRNTTEISMEIPPKKELEILFDTGTSFLGIFPKRVKDIVLQ